MSPAVPGPRARPGLRFLAVAAVLGTSVGVGLALRERGGGGQGFPAAVTAEAMAALPGGGLRFAEPPGRVRELDPAGRLRPGVVAAVEEASGPGGGILGLAVGRAGETYASWLEGDRTLAVGRVAPGPVRVVWRGPRAGGGPVGGRLALAPDGLLLVGLGDLGEPGAAADPARPNGKLYELDPAGPPDQRPVFVSAGWRNPLGFAVTPDNQLWVADDAAGGQPDRLARVTAGGQLSLATRLPPGTDPTGLAAPAPGRLVVCGGGSGKLLPYTIEAQGFASPAGAPLATDCRRGVVVLADGRLAYAAATAIKVLPAP